MGGFSRALVQGVVQRSQGSSEASQRAGNEEADSRLVTAVSGFPKPGSNYNIDNILKGQIGDDAYFVARHVDEWTSSDFDLTTAVGSSQTMFLTACWLRRWLWLNTARTRSDYSSAPIVSHSWPENFLGILNFFLPFL